MRNEAALAETPHIDAVSRALLAEAPYLEGVIGKQRARFGTEWLDHFERDLATFFGNDQTALENATRGYIKFALDGMLLQRRFDKTRVYEPKTYEEAAAEVYQNEQYMHTLYLPGLYLSHFLWQHHYLQHIHFVKKFVPMLKQHGGKTFYDVGVGTGFYSREMLLAVPDMQGQGFDLSRFALDYTARMVKAFGADDRYKTNLQDIIEKPPSTPADFVINVEVLEHLPDPVTFLKALNRMLAPGGLGMITAAVTAPNADHIYLYNSVDEVAAQVREAGFKVIEQIEDAAYEPKPGQTVPKNACVFVTK
ncbi:MAG: class I SAM-dependent methyltransferase [Xanthobacteraceae bacterium]|nr:class I SAM-dependent methyltransferase [Xanthobacteraceae bacterium]